MPEAESYRFDAFISYRHVEPDRRWAKWLHEALETFKTPKYLVAKGIAPRIRRVFRDEEELPASADLSSEIDTALRESRFLIVVCSPRTPESEWVNQEVVRFREMGRHDKILALLIEGEPHESFPRSLREIRTTITDERGEVHEHFEDVEPLAADVRASRDESEGFLKRNALLRCSAALLGCRFDDLRGRSAERERRRLVRDGVRLVALIAVLTGLTWYALDSKDDAEAARDEATYLSEIDEYARDKEAGRLSEYFTGGVLNRTAERLRRNDPEQARRLFTGLLTHDSKHVRFWAAKDLFHVDDAAALAALAAMDELAGLDYPGAAVLADFLRKESGRK